MKMIVLAALLAAAGCSKKSGTDCESAIAKGVDSMLATVKSSSSQQVRDSVKEIAGKLRTALTQRCTEDKWAIEVVECYAKLTTQGEMQACESKLSAEQRTKLRRDLIQIMTSTRMPGTGHPPSLSGSGAPGAGSAAPSGAAAPTGSTEPPAAATPPAAGSTPPAAAASPPAAPTASPPAATAPAAGSASGW